MDWGDKVSGVAIFIGSSVGSKGLKMIGWMMDAEMLDGSKRSGLTEHMLKTLKINVYEINKL